jgi:hypothetical protein
MECAIHDEEEEEEEDEVHIIVLNKWSPWTKYLQTGLQDKFIHSIYISNIARMGFTFFASYFSLICSN